MAAPSKKRAVHQEMKSLEADNDETDEMSGGSGDDMEEFEEEADDAVGQVSTLDAQRCAM